MSNLKLSIIVSPTRVATLLFCLLMWTTLAAAQVPLPKSTPATESATPSGIPRAPITVNKREIFQLSGETEDEAARRAEIVNRRLELLIEREEPVEKFEPQDIITQDGQPLITLGGEPVLTVTEADVADTLVPAQELALLWGNQLSNAVRAERIARRGPLSNAFMVLITAAEDLLKSVSNWLPRLLGVFVLALCFWPLAILARWVAKKATRSPRIDANLTQLAIAVSFYGMWGLGFLAMLSAIGINSTGIAAAVGASGFILGFAFQDVLSHFFAGMLLLMGRQFYIGGQIRVDEFEGTVERIDLRALYLRTYDNRQVTIPNGQVFNSAVIINTSNPHLRREFTIGISYESDTRRAMEIAERAMQGVEGVLLDPAPQALVSQLGASSVDLRMFFYTSATNTEWLKVLSECILLTKEAFDEAGINIPFSTHTIDVRHVGELAEVWKPMLEAAEKESGESSSDKK